MLRFWDPYVTSRPMAILKTHRSCIISVFIHTSLQMVFSYSKDKHVCVFDIKDQVCIQNICIKHPSGQTNIQEHGPSPLLYTGTSILVAANSYVAELKFMEPSLQQSGRAIDDYSHSTRVIDAIILQVKNQLLTACECGEIKLWNIKTGQLVDTLSDATNCFSELSCVGVDCTNEWLVCGYVDGTANLWSLTKGLKEKSLEKYSSKEITNVIVLPGMSAAFLFGWSRKILAYYDTKLSVSLKPDPDWLLLECHEDDILCAVYIRPLYIVTSSFDGDIYLWNIEYKRLARKIQIGRNRFKWRKKIFENFESPRNGLRSSRSRRSSNRAISSILFKEPVECLLYLTERSNGQYASLVSAEGSTIKFWSTIAVGLPTASFDICENEGVIVTSITSDKNNAVLVTGDSEGLVRVWSIEGYGGYNRFSEVILQVMRKQNSRQHSRSQATRTFPPPLLQSWLAHDSHVVTCLQIFENASSEKFLLSGGSDCRVFLWSLKGMKIGVFTRISRWNLDKKIRNGKKHVYEYENNKSNENNDILKSKDFVEVNNREGGDNLEKLHERIRKSSDEVHLEESALPWKQTYDLDGIKLSDCHSAREEIHQRIDKMKESWSLLGENYNNEFRVRMTNRLNRRLAESLDNPVNGAGGLTMCTPFSKVMIKDLDDITLSTKDFSLVKSKDLDVTASKYAGKNI